MNLKGLWQKIIGKKANTELPLDLESKEEEQKKKENIL